MTKIEAWKTTKTVYYTRALKNRNSFGNYDSACTRKETFWSAKSEDGRQVEGFTTRRDAIAALQQ